MHIFKILGTYCLRAFQKEWSNWHPNPTLNENTQDQDGFYGIVFLCYCGPIGTAISTFSPKQSSWTEIQGTHG